jgi:purine-binding chemotaxis protein CheW
MTSAAVVAAPLPHVVFSVGSCEYVLPASQVIQMESFEGATRVPGAKPYVAGVVQVRGRVVPVIDLRARFGVSATERTLDTRVLVVEHAGRVVALLADRAREIVRLGPDALRPPPPLIAAQSAGFVTAIAHLGSRIVMLIDVPSVLGEE